MGSSPTAHNTNRGLIRSGIAATASVAAALALAAPAQAQQEWELVHGSIEQGGSYTAVAATAPDDVWVFGADNDSGAPWLHRWDGQGWQEELVPDGLNAPPIADVGRDGQIWAVASNPTDGASAIHHDGESWRASAIDNELEPTALAAVGEGRAWLLSDSAGEPEAAYFDGHEWTPQPAPSVTRGLGAAEAGEVFAVGGQGSELVVERWDGFGWTPEEIPEVDIPGGEPGAAFNDVLVRSADDVLAVGHISWKDADERNHQRPVLARYDGTEWTVRVADDPGSYDAVVDDGEGGVYLAEGQWNPTLVHVPADGASTRRELLADDHDVAVNALVTVPGAGAVAVGTAFDRGDPDEPTSHARVYGTGTWY